MLHFTEKEYNFILILTFIFSFIFNEFLYPKDNYKYMHAYFIYLNGLNYEKNNKIDDAMKYYNKSIIAYKSFPEPYFRIGVIYKRKAELKKAEYYFKKAEKYVSKFRNSIETFNFLKEFGKTCYKLKNYDKAIECYSNSLKIRKDYTAIYMIGKLYYLKKNYIKSENYLNMYINFCFDNKKINYKNEDLKQALKLIINIEMDNEEYIKALKHLKKLYDLEPNKYIKNKISILSNNLRYYEKK